MLQAGVVVSGQEEEQEQRDDGWLSICGGQRMHAINSEWLTKQHSTAQHRSCSAPAAIKMSTFGQDAKRDPDFPDFAGVVGWWEIRAEIEM